MENVILTFLAGGLAGALLLKCKVPGGMLIGALTGVAALQLLTGAAYMPQSLKVFAQIITGAYIACGMGKEQIKDLPAYIKPAFLIIANMLITNIALGFLMAWAGNMDLLTALLGAMPGGVSDIPLVAGDLGADMSQVAILQILRLMMGVGLFPVLSSLVARKGISKHTTAKPKENPALFESRKQSSPWRMALTLAIGAAGGLLGKALGAPAGALVFSMFAVLTLNLKFGIAHMPRWMRRIAQVLSGAYIGVSIQPANISALKGLILPALILLAGYFLNCLSTSLILHKKFGFPLMEAMFSSTPAGASDMALISADFGLESATVAKLQIIRIITVLSIFPQMITGISKSLT